MGTIEGRECDPVCFDHEQKLDAVLRAGAKRRKRKVKTRKKRVGVIGATTSLRCDCGRAAAGRSSSSANVEREKGVDGRTSRKEMRRQSDRKGFEQRVTKKKQGKRGASQKGREGACWMRAPIDGSQHQLFLHVPAQLIVMRSLLERQWRCCL